MSKFKVTFTLDEADANYFRKLYREAKRGAKDLDADEVIADARGIVKQVRASKKTPSFVLEAVDVLTDLVDLVQDDEYAAPKKVRDEVLAGLAYFSNPDDLIPDRVPGLGYLDDAIMVELVVQDLKHEIEAFDAFVVFREERAKKKTAAGDGLEKRRASLQGRMRRRRRGDRGRRSR